MEGVLLNFGMGVLGLLTFVVFTSLDKIRDKNYGLTQHFNENYKRWVWALSMLILIVLTLHLDPSISNVINGALEFPLLDKVGTYWAIGVALAKIIKETVKKIE